MKGFLLFLIASVSFAFAETVVIDNQTTYPSANKKIAVQWAESAREVEDNIKASTYGLKMDPKTLQTLTTQGKISLKVPSNAKYFRVLAWTQGRDQSDLLTDWLDVVNDKTYPLKEEYLIPACLISGTGC